ncbi:MAG: DNA/RNA nuclease SfsA [Ruminococcaceae bacterium]|nr:DNA/RNA nuclease SfsA [Oscillospiraceae bacterium]
MKYEKIVKGIFLMRPNRFIAKVLVDGKEETVHVKNTGRCRELLTENAEVFLSLSSNPARKTKYDLVAVKKGSKLINMDSQIPNDVAEEWLKKGNLFSADAVIRREVTRGKSRFDFYIEDGERKIFLEVKGVTLENDGIAMFPDAPTERGVKHINELVSLKNQGYEAFVLFVIQMEEVTGFKPNDITHKAFGDALREAEKAGVTIVVVNCRVTETSIDILDEIPFLH